MIHRPGLGEFPPGAQMPMRTLEDCELVWMLQGTAQLTGEEEVELLPGDLLFIPTGLRHGLIWDARRPTRHGYVHFDAAEVSVRVPERPERVRMTADDPLAGLCAYLQWLGAEDLDDWGTHARRALNYLLSLMVELPLPSASSAPAMSQPLRTAVEHLRRRWAETPLERVSVAELARAAAVSRGHLSRVFHAEVGVGPATAMERLRCARAETLLSRTDLSLALIARDCGYADVSHLSHRFRSLEGSSPSRFRATGGTATVLEHAGIRRLAREVWGTDAARPTKGQG